MEKEMKAESIPDEPVVSGDERQMRDGDEWERSGL